MTFGPDSPSAQNTVPCFEKGVSGMKGNSNSHGARPVHLIITMIKWIRTRRLSIKNALSGPGRA